MSTPRITFDNNDLLQIWEALTVSVNTSNTNGPAFNVSPVLGAGSYVIGDCVGGLISLASLLPFGDQSAKISSIMAYDTEDQGPAIDIYFFNDEPTGTYTDGAALTIDPADVPFIEAVISLEASQWEDKNGLTQISGSGIDKIIRSLNLIDAEKSGSIWAVVGTRSACTYAVNDSLNLRFFYE